jgi:hypothetical protein
MNDATVLPKGKRSQSAPPRSERAPADLWSLLTVDRRQRLTARLSEMIQRRLQLNSQGRDVHAEDYMQLK